MRAERWGEQTYTDTNDADDDDADDDDADDGDVDDDNIDDFDVEVGSCSWKKILMTLMLTLMIEVGSCRL